MSIVDKVIAAVTPPESEEARVEARAQARAAATPGSWLAMVLEHHGAIDNAFAAVKQASDTGSRRAAQLELATLLNAHSLAEEVVLYPALALNDEKGHATAAYTEQSATKVQMAALEGLDPMGQDYLDKLEHIRGAVAHHVYEEEGDWFLELDRSAGPEVGRQLTQRYSQEFNRYMKGARDDAPHAPAPGGVAFSA